MHLDTSYKFEDNRHALGLQHAFFVLQPQHCRERPERYQTVLSFFLLLTPSVPVILDWGVSLG